MRIEIWQPFVFGKGKHPWWVGKRDESGQTLPFLKINGDIQRFKDVDGAQRKADHLNQEESYWGEKLQSISVNSGYREFCKDTFREKHVLDAE